MKQYTSAAILREDAAKGHVPPTLIIEVSTELMARLMDESYRTKDGRVMVIDSVTVHYDTSLERTIANPLVKQLSQTEVWVREGKRLRDFINGE